MQIDVDIATHITIREDGPERRYEHRAHKYCTHLAVELFTGLSACLVSLKGKSRSVC